MAKKSSGDMMAGGDGMSPRKAMASGKGDGGGNFGVDAYGNMHGGAGMHPDAKAGTGAMGAMDDGDRGIGDPVHHTKGHLPAQASPNHGPTHPGGHMANSGHGGTRMKA